MLTAAHVFKIEHKLRKFYGLTHRQLAVLAASVEVDDFHALSERCGITPKTARVHMSRVYRLLGVKSKFQCYRKVEEIFELCT